MFNPTNVDAIMGVFNKTIDKLRAASSHHDREAERHREVAQESIAKSSVHMNESARASRLVERLTEIVR